MKIAFITIGTGEYRKLVSPLTDSIGEFMLKSHEIRTVAFADDKISTDIYRKIEALPWPLTTLFKYRYINTLSSDLSGCDMMYFIDADCRVVAPIGEEIFPERGQIVVVEHPWQQFNSGAYENNPKSTAYVNRETCKNHYFQVLVSSGDMRKIF